MGEYTFSQRRHTNGQQAHETVLSITIQQESTNQNHNKKIHLRHVRMAIIKKQKITNVGEDEKMKPVYTVGRNANWHSCYGKHYRDSSKT